MTKEIQSDHEKLWFFAKRNNVWIVQHNIILIQSLDLIVLYILEEFKKKMSELIQNLGFTLLQ